jgi:ABC-type phosphate/phosphonate transport system substrate-binding protein
MFAEVNENDAGAAVKVWAQMLGRDRGIPVDPAARVLRGTAEIGEALRAGRVDALTLTTDEYWTLRELLSREPIIVATSGGRLAEEYVLVTRRQGGIAQVADLRQRSLNILQNARATLAMVWMETLLAEAGLGRPATVCSRVDAVSNLSRAVLPVFFGRVDACVVTRTGLEAMTELNPQVGRELKIVATSPGVVPTLFCFRGNYVSPFREKLVAELGRMSSSAAGRQFMTMFQCGDFFKQPASCLDSAFELLERHHRVCAAAPAEAAGAAASQAHPEARQP